MPLHRPSIWNTGIMSTIKESMGAHYLIDNDTHPMKVSRKENKVTGENNLKMRKVKQQSKNGHVGFQTLPKFIQSSWV